MVRVGKEEPSVVTHAFNPIASEVEVDGFQVSLGCTTQ